MLDDACVSSSLEVSRLGLGLDSAFWGLRARAINQPGRNATAVLAALCVWFVVGGWIERVSLSGCVCIVWGVHQSCFDLT